MNNTATTRNTSRTEQRLFGSMSEFAIESLLNQHPLAGIGFVFRCPACGCRLRAEVLAEGKLARCPACATQFHVPGLA